jgi:hypothetical protein
MYRERRKKRPASRKQSYVQSHKHATQQGYETQSEAEPDTPNPHTGRETGLKNHLLHTHSILPSNATAQSTHCLLLHTHTLVTLRGPPVRPLRVPGDSQVRVPNSSVVTWNVTSSQLSACPAPRERVLRTWPFDAVASGDKPPHYAKGQDGAVQTVVAIGEQHRSLSSLNCALNWLF